MKKVEVLNALVVAEIAIERQMKDKERRGENMKARGFTRERGHGDMIDRRAQDIKDLEGHLQVIKGLNGKILRALVAQFAEIQEEIERIDVRTHDGSALKNDFNNQAHGIKLAARSLGFSVLEFNELYFQEFAKGVKGNE